MRAIIPLPDPNAQPDSPEHLNAYPLFGAGSTVMALYPDTSCFYRAEVISSPKDMQGANRVSLPADIYVIAYGPLLDLEWSVFETDRNAYVQTEIRR